MGFYTVMYNAFKVLLFDPGLTLNSIIGIQKVVLLAFLAFLALWVRICNKTDAFGTLQVLTDLYEPEVFFDSMSIMTFCSNKDSTYESTQKCGFSVWFDWLLIVVINTKSTWSHIKTISQVDF